MCGRFAQYQASQTIWPSAEQDVISEYDSVPIARYNVAPSNKVHMLHGETRGIHLGAVRWGWAPHWGSISRVSGEWCTTQKKPRPATRLRSRMQRPAKSGTASTGCTLVCNRPGSPSPFTKGVSAQ